MENREKRDLPEVVAEILIEQHAMREAMEEMRGAIVQLGQQMVEGNTALCQEIKESNTAFMAQQERLFNNQTNAILDAMGRNTDRYRQTNERLDQMETRVTKRENPPA